MKRVQSPRKSSSAPTQREITAEDAPKIALALGLAVAFLGAGWFSFGKANVQHEQDRMMRHMKLETGTLSADIDPNLSPAEADEAQNERELTDPNFQP